MRCSKAEKLLPSHSPLILGTTWQIFRPFFLLIHRTTIKGNILFPKMLQETWQELLKLHKEPRFTRNLTLLFFTVITSSLTLATEYSHPARLAQQQRLTQFSPLVSAGIVIRTYEILLKQK